MGNPFIINLNLIFFGHTYSLLGIFDLAQDFFKECEEMLDKTPDLYIQAKLDFTS